MKAILYKVVCLTNMHVGSGDINYNIIDNEVEKDVVIGEATINPSGVKGAIREHIEKKWLKGLNGDDYNKVNNKIQYIFGSEHKPEKTNNEEAEEKKKPQTSQNADKENQNKSKPGSYKFFSASLISRPLRVSNGNVSYINVTTVEILNNFIDLLSALKIDMLNGEKVDLACIKKELKKLEEYKFLPFNPQIHSIEGEECEFAEIDIKVKEFLSKLIEENCALSNCLREYELPVIARNSLKEDGTSDNLWYEEIVPHKSIFYFPILIPDKESKLDFQNELIQFGGNASIGYGYTLVTKVGESNE